jgi:ribosomal protein S18 acetylase RimI-like enzyme
VDDFSAGAQALLIRRLTGTDARTFREVRLAGLQAHPDAFGSSWEEEAEHPPSWFEERVQNGYVAGCELDGALVGVAGLYRGDRLKTRHRGTLWGMYVAPQARRRGVGAELVQDIIDAARGTVEELNLTVAAHNEPAIRLYRRFGFADLGLDPHALKIGDAYVDEMLMRLAF